MHPQVAKSLYFTLLVLLPACKFNCSVGKDLTEKVQSSVEKKLLAQVGIKTSIVCPELKSKDSASCEAKTEDGSSFPVTVSKNDEDSWSFQTEGVAFGSQVEKKFRELYSEKFGLVLEKVVCPDAVLRGAVATCQGSHQGVNIPIEVMYTEQNGRDDLDFKPKSGLLSVVKIEAALLEKTRAKGVTKVDCGKARLMVSKPQARFECQLLGASGPLGTQKILIEDETGQVKFE